MLKLVFPTQYLVNQLMDFDRTCSWPPKSSKYFSVGIKCHSKIFEYILASMLNVFLDD